MKSWFAALAFLALATLCTGCGDQEKVRKNEEKALNDSTKEYQEAFNHKNIEKFSSLWATDAVFFNPITGEEAAGREAITQLFKEKFSNEPQKRLEIAIREIEFPTPDEAIQKGIMKIFVPDEPTQRIAFQLAYIKENDKWVIDEVRQIEIEPSSSNFDHLQELSWLVGSWEDADDNVQIELQADWDKYRNFLTQHFKLKIFGEEDLEGKQIIAWDPTEQKIRSWVFDSNGTYGEGNWSKMGKSWVIPMKYTLSDGAVATATNVYTPIDEKSYTFASIDREIDGEILPNMDPVQVERVK